jgi:hypothetical protein
MTKKRAASAAQKAQSKSRRKRDRAQEKRGARIGRRRAAQEARIPSCLDDLSVDEMQALLAEERIACTGHLP